MPAPDLAARIPYSYSLLRAVEEGTRTASSGLIAAVAEELRIDVAALKGQPYVTELQQDRLLGLIRPIREALDLYDIGDDPDLPVRTADQLTAAAHRAPATELWQALGSTYRTAHDVATKLGFPDLSTVALDRMGWAAERASDPLLGAARQYMRALAYFRGGECAIGHRLIGLGRRHLEQAGPGREGLAVSGQLHLGSAVLHARARNESSVTKHLDEAEKLARRTGEAGDVLWMSFGPTNVNLHRTSTLIEMRQYGEAVEQSRGLHFPGGWSTSRAAGTNAQGSADCARADALLPPGPRNHSRPRPPSASHPRDTLDHMAAWVGL